MRRLVTLVIAASMLVIPSAALAQSAGDEQYADPFGQVDEPNGGQDQGQGQAPEQDAQAPAAPAQASPTTGEQSVASQEAGSPTLPRTGLDAVFIVVLGSTLLLAGTTIRRIAS